MTKHTENSEKDDYVNSLQAKVDLLSEKLFSLRKMLNNEVSDQKGELDKLIVELEVKLDATKSKLAEITKGTEESLHGLKERAELLSSEISQSIKKFLKRK